MTRMSTTARHHLIEISRDIKLSHTVFAMPFALLAACMAAGGWPAWSQMALIVLCMVFARTFAMLANRYLDRKIDADNPRTAGRALPAGRLSAADARRAMGGSAAAFIAATAGFGVWHENWWPLMLSPAVLLWIGAYGYLKRFTAFCHLYLGTALAISPVAAALAISPPSLAGPGLWWLSGFVLLWVTGFDVIYALQDQAFDQQAGLHSIPARWGRTGALWFSRLIHALALTCLAMAAHASPALQTSFAAATAAVGLLLVVEHVAAARGRFSMAFFTFNGLISLVLGAVGIVEILINP